MKPFDLERAKAGAPVQTRSDRAARIVAFDRNHPDFPLVALVTYEPVFGDQSLFDGMLPDCEFIVGTYGYKIKDGKCFYCEKYNHKYGWSPTGDAAKALSPVIAMRRIIAEPKRWTVEDKKAGRLPDVGSIGLTNYGRAEYLGNDSTSIDKCHVRYEDGYCERIAIEKFTPLETPEEKAERLREEWCYTAAKQLKNLEYSSTLTSIYDALLSGELTMPVKDGE